MSDTSDSRESNSRLESSKRWVRFWVPRSSHLELVSGGFLADPETDYGRAANPDAAVLEQLVNYRMLVLLGEPGMGKTDALRQYESRLAADREEVLLIDLRNYESFSDLRTSVLEGNEINVWRRGERSLTLLLDSLDEALVESSALADRIAIWIADVARESSLRDRFRVAIACRTSVWPESAELKLRKAWSTNEMGVFVLAPLRRADALNALRHQSVADPNAALREIVDRNLGALAARPGTLQMLAMSARSGSLPSSQAQLFEDGCRRLLTETNPGRIERRHSGALSPLQRLAIASRIAAISVLSNRGAVKLEAFSVSRVDSKNEFDISVSDIGGGVEPVFSWDSLRSRSGINAETVNVSVAALREVLDSQLFETSSPGMRHHFGADEASPPNLAQAIESTDAGYDFVQVARRDWAHRSFAEFLAARWIRANELTQEQVDQLFFARVEGERRVVPQLRQTAAWFAGLDHQFLQRLLQCEPTVLLRCDFSALDDDERCDLTAKLLDLARADALEPEVYWSFTEFRGLLHRTLSTQLLAAIRDPAEPLPARLLALRIGAATGMAGLVDAAVDVALDLAQSGRLRRAAIRLLGARRADPRRRALRALLGLESSAEPLEQRTNQSLKSVLGEDPNDDIRGEVLSALWPEELSLDECLSLLTPPKLANYLGAYRSFIGELSDAIARNGLTDAELSGALKFVASFDGNEARRTHGWYPYGGTLERLRAAILQVAWKRLAAASASDPLDAIERNLVAAIVRDMSELLTGHRNEAHAYAQNALESAHLRRRIARGAFERIARSDSHIPIGVMFRYGVLRPDDALWLLELAVRESAAGNSEFGDFLAQALRQLLWWGGHEPLSAVYVAKYGLADEHGLRDALGNPDVIDRALAPLIRPVALNSEEANTGRLQRREMAELERSTTGRAREAAQAIEHARGRERETLEQVLRGDNDAWWHLNYWLSVSSDGYVNELDSDLTKLPRWRELDEETRSKLFECGRRYIVETGEARDQWSSPRSPTRPARAGFRALRLLASEDGDALNGLPREVWNRWASTIVGYPLLGDEDDGGWYTAMLTCAYQNAPEHVTEAIVEVVREEDSHDHGPLVLGRVEVLLTLRESAVLERGLMALVRARSDAGVEAGSQAESTKRLSARGVERVLGVLVRYEVREAVEYARNVLLELAKAPDTFDASRESVSRNSGEDVAISGSAQPSARDLGQETEEILAAAKALVQEAKDAAWDAVWPALSANATFARRLLGDLAGTGTWPRGALVCRLTEAQVADLYLLMGRLFPQDEESREEEEEEALAPRSEVAYLRDSLLQHLSALGTEESVAEVRRLRQALPAQDGLKYAERAAISALQRGSWMAPSISELLSLARGKQRRLVRSEADLLDVVVQLLHGWQAELRGVNASIEMYWDRVGTGRWRPKGEETLSNGIASLLRRELTSNGIVSAREVRIRPGIGASPAQDVDIFVQATLEETRGPSTSASVLLEVKGQWFRGLRDSMRTQLVERYLDRNDETGTGLFVVGWYQCQEWDDDDPRKGDARRNGAELSEFRWELDRIAARLSSAQRVVRAIVLDLSLSS